MQRQTIHSKRVHQPESNHQNQEFSSLSQAANYGNNPSIQNREIRFTFNRLIEDTIKEQENEDQSFCKVDYGEMVELRKMVNAYKAQNLRLVQQSTDNIHLFNTYMQEMEERAAEKKGEAESLKYRIKLLEERYFKCQEELKKAEARLLQNRRTTREEGVQCEIRPVFTTLYNRTLNQHQDQTRDNKINQFIAQANSNHPKEQNTRSSAQSFQKNARFREVQEQYNNLRSIYFKSLSNTPRTSVKHRNGSILSQQGKLQQEQKYPVSALISPRMSPNHYRSSYQSLTNNKKGDYLVNMPLRLNKQNHKSTVNDSSTLQFSKYLRHQRRK